MEPNYSGILIFYNYASIQQPLFMAQIVTYMYNVPPLYTVTYVTGLRKPNILDYFEYEHTCICKFIALNTGNINGYITKRCISLMVEL